jgi:hypothetical protein
MFVGSNQRDDRFTCGGCNSQHDFEILEITSRKSAKSGCTSLCMCIGEYSMKKFAAKVCSPRAPTR